MLAVWGAHERVNGLLPPLHAPFDGVAGDFSRIPAALATGAMSKWAYEKTMSSTWEEVMNENCRILFAAIISTIATAAPLSSLAQECDGDYYPGIGANQHYTGDKRQPTNTYIFKHRANQQQPQRATDAAHNRAPT